MPSLSKRWLSLAPDSHGRRRIAIVALVLVVGSTSSSFADDPLLPGPSVLERAKSSRIENDVLIREFSADDLSAASVSTEGIAGANLGLLNGRFSVSVTYRTPSNQSGSGMVVPGVSSPDSGLFYFCGQQNWEILVKAVDLCGVPGAGFYTVIAAAATDVEFRLVVTDNVAGITRTYENPLGNKPVAVRDSFATCGSTPPPPPPPAGCPTNGPVTDLTRDCSQYAYFYRLGAVISALSSDSQDAVICTGSPPDTDVICQIGPVQGPTSFSLTAASLNSGPLRPLGAGSSGTIANSGRVLNYTIILNGERFNFNGLNWIETQSVNSASEAATSGDGSGAPEARVLEALKQTLRSRSSAAQASIDPASSELAAVLSVQSESTR